ncbi:signal recognition particle, SRP9/SRP14 subunit [Mycena amicta]|nr:signal recognition particle, SRP9/SRP14 subunit [Mycena amicta]
MYIHGWQEYQDRAEALYASSPNTTRYCVKWRASESKLVLKITDNNTCLKFKTSSSIFLNRFEALNLALMQKMQNRRPPPPSLPTVVVKAESPAPVVAAAAQASSAVPKPAVASGGVKKKPKKKK